MGKAIMPLGVHGLAYAAVVLIVVEAAFQIPLGDAVCAAIPIPGSCRSLGVYGGDCRSLGGASIAQGRYPYHSICY